MDVLAGGLVPNGFQDLGQQTRNGSQVEPLRIREIQKDGK